jgi:Transcriptional regulatory protein, C terminal
VIPVEELRQAVWGGTRVGSGAIRVCVRELRQALEDEATAPQYIETVGRQGYRFIGGGGGWGREPSLPSPPSPVSGLQLQTSWGASGSWRGCNSGLRRRNRGTGKWCW